MVFSGLKAGDKFLIIDRGDYPSGLVVSIKLAERVSLVEGHGCCADKTYSAVRMYDGVLEDVLDSTVVTKISL